MLAMALVSMDTQVFAAVIEPDLREQFQVTNAAAAAHDVPCGILPMKVPTYCSKHLGFHADQNKNWKNNRSISGAVAAVVVQWKFLS